MVDRRVKDGLRAGAAAVGVASGLMVLASTSQTTDGFIHASFGGPMDVFSNTSSSDVLVIGDGTSDASELAAILQGPTSTSPGVPDSPIRAAFEAGSAPGPTTPNVMPLVDPTAAPAIKDSAILPVKPVVDSQGHVDCTGALSCKTDPVTNITTVTFPDGVIAIVQKINDLTVVAYKTMTDFLPADVKALLPAPVTTSPSALAAQAPASVQSTPTAAVPSSAPTSAPPTAAPETSAPSFDPGPLAPPDNELMSPNGQRPGPKVNVTRGPIDFSPDSSTSPQKPVLGKMKDALGTAVNTVTDAIGKALSPGASGKPTTSGGSPRSGTGATPSSP